jgi:flagellar biosynthesis/type III secretory pathway M-ring protein FliF/YscJ
MPPQLQALLQNRNAMIAAGALLLLAIVLLVVLLSGSGQPPKGGGLLDEKQLNLAEVESIGKAIEIQALLAREGLRLDQEAGDGGKVKVRFGKEATKEDRDRALIALVQSGLMDKNVGLEAFDKGDLTASREEKRIKLIRAQQGELARLIRKIPPIQEATVSLSIPEPSLFKSDQKPMSASVQVVVPNGDRLTRDKVRSIINLVVGSVQGLDAQHVALADTNGNTYNSVLDVGSELNDKLEEQDQYMKQKVTAQLDKLVGPGNYVVTVSTLLREAPKETMTQTYDPSQSAVSSKQSFSERLGSGQGRTTGTGGVVSTMPPPGVEPGGTNTTTPNMPPLSAATGTGGGGGIPTAPPLPGQQSPTVMGPGQMPAQNGAVMLLPGQSASQNNRGYVRTGSELSYATGKTQVLETSLPGMLEDISIAVSIDRGHFPSTMNEDQLKKLIANAANPKVHPDNVTIAKTDFQHAQALDEDKLGSKSSAQDDGTKEGMPVWALWGAGGAILLSLLMIAMTFIGGNNNKGPSPAERQQMQQTQQELLQLREFTLQQQAQLQEAQAQTQRMLEAQQRQLTQIANTPAPSVASQVLGGMAPAVLSPAQQQQAQQLRDTLLALRETMNQDDLAEDELQEPLRTWIEST